MDRRSLLDRAAKSAEERVLLGHILDKYDQCRQRNLPTNTAFLSPAEAQGARDLLRAAAIHEGFALLGGYEGAERRMLFFLPDWQEEADASDAMAFLRAAWHESEHPTHRDLLGSLMALGVERETLGDILVSEGSADLIVSAGVAQYLLDNWTGAGRTALRLTAIGADALRVPEQKVKEIRDTVATLRLDAVTAAGFSVSRGKAAELIAAGRVQKNYREVTKGDASVAQGDVISARGLGKFEVAEVGGLSKKGAHGHSAAPVSVRRSKMEQKKIDRINELAKLAKERELTDEEKVERAALRQEYVNSVLGDLRNQLNNTYVMDEKGNKTKLTQWSEDHKLSK